MYLDPASTVGTSVRMACHTGGVSIFTHSVETNDCGANRIKIYYVMSTLSKRSSILIMPYY